jgi:predicted permease
MTNLMQDFRFGIRVFRKSPGFTLIAILTLALGIGANTALFSVVNAVLLSPLPYSHAEQLVSLHASKTNFEHGSISYPNFLDWQKENHTFSAMAVYRSLVFNLTGSGEAEQLFGQYVSADFFSILDTQPVLGRNFLRGEDRIGGAPLAMISAGLWQRKFNSSPDILNKTLTLNGTAYTVIGVVPAKFSLPVPYFQRAELYVPIGQFDKEALQHRDWGLGIHGIARLKPGVTFAQAKSDMAAVSQDLARAYPDSDKDTRADLIPLREQVVGQVRPYLLTLLGAVSVILLIACVNVANLLLARSTGRNREFAIRASLGAGRARVVRQLITESLILSAGGGLLGVVFANYGVRAALTVLPQALPRTENIGVDQRVLWFTAGLSILTGLLAGVIPALSRTARIDLSDTLKQGGRSLTGAHHRTQSVFVVAQMALAMVLLIGAGLMIRTLVYLWHIDPGFKAQNVMTFGLSFPAAMNTAKPEVIRQQYHQLEENLSALPGIKNVSFLWGALPLAGDDENAFWVEGRPKPRPEDMPMAIDYIVSPGYLEAMSIALQRGRFFTRHDDEHAPAVVVIDTAFARKYFPDQDPVGQRINLANDNRQVEIIGVVGHVKQWSLDSDARISPLEAQFYLPWAQVSDQYTMSYGSGSFSLVQSDGRDPNLLDTLRHAVHQISADMVIANAEPMTGIVADSLATRRFAMILLSIFAGLALLLASIGIYGVISYTVGARTQEIGVRMALGAERGHILRLVLSNGGKLLMIGVGVGLIASLAVSRVMTSQIAGVRSTDPLTFLAVSLVLGMVGLLACYLPAYRASRVDPMVSLRQE